jgi:hypothetical protein
MGKEGLFQVHGIFLIMLSILLCGSPEGIAADSIPRVEVERQTEVKLCSDHQFLYIGVVCYGPDVYVIKTLKRDKDFPEGDGFGEVIDPVNERTNGFAVGVSPAGVQTEYLVPGSH